MTHHMASLNRARAHAGWMTTRRGMAVAALLAVICFANTCTNQLVFDDIEVISGNPLVTRAAIDLPGIFTSHYWAHVRDTGNLYRPLTILTYALNHAAGGETPLGYHVVNILLHALVSVVLVLLAGSMGLKPWPSLLAGALFAVHPIHTEAVAGVVGRAELLAGLFVLLGWYIHLPGRPAGWRSTILLASLFAAGLLSKENAIVLPGLMLLSDLWRGRDARVRPAWRLPHYAACAVVVAGWLLLRWWALPSQPFNDVSDSPFEGIAPASRVATALVVLLRYLGLMVAPVTMSADYSFDQIPIEPGLLHFPAIFGFSVAGAILGLAIVAILSGSRGRETRLAGLGALAFFIALAPVSNMLVPIGTVMGERLLYLPSAGFCLALPALFAALARYRKGLTKTLAALSVLLILLGVARTIVRNADWRDQLTLFTATASASPRSAKARYNLGRALEDAGRGGEAIAAYAAAIAIRPADQRSRFNLALLLAADGGRDVEAIEQMQEALRLDPTLPEIHATLGALLHRAGKYEEAEAVFRQALTAGTTITDQRAATYNLGTMQLERGRLPEALESLRESVRLGPSVAEGHHQLGIALLEAGEFGPALSELAEALRLSPDPPEALIPIARALMALGRGEESAAALARAKEAGLAIPDEPVYYSPLK